MPTNYTVKAITFNYGNNPNPLEEIERLQLKLHYQDEYPGMFTCPLLCCIDRNNPRNLGGWVSRCIEDTSPYKQTIVDTALAGMVNNYLPFFGYGKVTIADYNRVDIRVLWQLLHNELGFYHFWINHVLIEDFPELVELIPRFDGKLYSKEIVPVGDKLMELRYL